MTFSQLEILKVFSGINTHDSSIYIPVFSNQQNISLLADEIEYYIKEYDIACVEFYDLTTILKRSWIIEFCKIIIERNLSKIVLISKFEP